MEWLNDLLRNETVAHTIFLYSAAITVGVFLGERKIRCVSHSLSTGYISEDIYCPTTNIAFCLGYM
jgi:hypothetical protein